MRQLTGVSKLNFAQFEKNQVNLRLSIREAKLQYLRGTGINYTLASRLIMI